MTRQQLLTTLAVFSLIIFFSFVSFFAGSHKIFAQSAGDPVGYYNNGVLCADQSGNDLICTYYGFTANGTQCSNIDVANGIVCTYPAGGAKTVLDKPPSDKSTTLDKSPGDSGGTLGPLTIPNPLKGSNTLYGFISDLINGVVLPIGGVLAVLYIMYAGFLMVTARGSEEQIKTGRAAFTHAAIGTAILLGAWVIAKVIETTIKSLTG